MIINGSCQIFIQNLNAEEQAKTKPLSIEQGKGSTTESKSQEGAVKKEAADMVWMPDIEGERAF